MFADGYLSHIYPPHRIMNRHTLQSISLLNSFTSKTHPLHFCFRRSRLSTCSSHRPCSSPSYHVLSAPPSPPTSSSPTQSQTAAAVSSSAASPAQTSRAAAPAGPSAVQAAVARSQRGASTRAPRTRAVVHLVIPPTVAPWCLLMCVITLDISPIVKHNPIIRES